MLTRLAHTFPKAAALLATSFIALALMLTVHRCRATPDLEIAGVARRPLVIVSGTTEQLPTADYLSSAGGLTVNGTASAAGDVQADTATIGTTLTAGAFAGTTQSTTVTSTQNNFALNANTTILRWAGASAATLGGITGGVSGRVLIIVNASAAQTLTLSNLGSGSTAANQMINIASADLVLSGTNSAAIYEYGSASNNWRMVSFFSTQVGYSPTFVAGMTLSNSMTGTTGAFTSAVVAQSTGSHYRTTISTAATVSACGTSPTVSGTDAAGRITLGTTSSGGCTLTFKTTYTNPPSCVVRFEDAATNAAVSYTVTATTLVITGASDAKLFDYFCIGLF